MGTRRQLQQGHLVLVGAALEGGLGLRVEADVRAPVEIGKGYLRFFGGIHNSNGADAAGILHHGHLRHRFFVDGKINWAVHAAKLQKIK